MSVAPINKEFQCANCGHYTRKLHKDENHEYTCKRISMDDIIKSGGLMKGKLTGDNHEK